MKYDEWKTTEWEHETYSHLKGGRNIRTVPNGHGSEHICTVTGTLGQGVAYGKAKHIVEMHNRSLSGTVPAAPKGGTGLSTSDEWKTIEWERKFYTAVYEFCNMILGAIDVTLPDSLFVDMNDQVMIMESILTPDKGGTGLPTSDRVEALFSRELAKLRNQKIILMAALEKISTLRCPIAAMEGNTDKCECVSCIASAALGAVR